MRWILVGAVALALLPLAGAAPGTAGAAFGFARGNTCEMDYAVVVEYDAVLGSAGLRTQSDPLRCGSHYFAWRPGLCSTDEQMVFRCKDHYPITVASVTTLYAYQWLNLTIEPDGDTRYTSEFERSPANNKIVEGRLTLI